MSSRMIAQNAALFREPDPGQAREVARNAYIATGGQTVLINKDWLDTNMDRELLDTLAQQALGVKGNI